MRTILLLTITATLLSSCGTFKKTVHSEEQHSSSSSTVQAVETKTVIERADTIVRTKADSVRTTGSLEAIVKGDTLRAQTDKTEVEIYYDPTTRKIVAKGKSKAQEVPVSIERTTVSETKTNKVEVSEQNRKVRDVDKERKNGGVGYLLGITSALFLLIILYVAYRYFKSKL